MLLKKLKQMKKCTFRVSRLMEKDVIEHILKETKKSIDTNQKELEEKVKSMEDNIQEQVTDLQSEIDKVTSLINI